ncbi:winged helix-turn-helix domain-containing protein [Maricaulis sp.]|uniref:winged helix-turn-helix domain-containing protein n=1 Tax=Maricaulis sp. TaxID=1486257 RepID=UPI002B272B75|nr:winged helix-turn-helix domain-containing protein [Maricaulis sp.]
MTGIPQTKPKDDVAWCPYLLLSQSGATGPELAQMCGLSKSTVNRNLRRLRAYDAEALAELQERAIERRKDEAVIEFLIGDPGKATRIANALAALCKLDRAKPGTPATPKPTDEEDAIDDAARQARDDAFLRRYILDADDARTGEGVAQGGEAAGPRRDPYRLPLPRDGPATAAAG